MMRRSLAALVVLLVAACGSAPQTYYTLAFAGGAQMRTPPISIELHRVGVAAYLDRPEIVTAPAAYRVAVSNNERWAEPLGRMLERVFAEDLVQRLPAASVFTESGAIAADADRILELDVQRLDVDGAGNVVLVAQIAVRRDGNKRPALARTFRLSAAAVPGQPAAAAISALVGQLADEAARMIAG